MIDQTPDKQGKNRDEEGKFLPGVSGNYGGRPRGEVSLTSQIKQRLKEIPQGEKETYLELITTSVVEGALKGDYRYIKLIWEHLDGTPRQAIEVAGDSNRPHMIMLDR
jgi:hypothetical protein